jgi:hypothetical protein
VGAGTLHLDLVGPNVSTRAIRERAVIVAPKSSAF